MNIHKLKKGKWIVFAMFLFFFLFQFIQIFRFQFYVQSDDFGYIANTAYFGGYNWNPYTGNMAQYFNIGFPVFSAFLFKIFHDPVTIYQGMLFTIIVWQMLLMYLVYRLVYEFFEMKQIASAAIALLYSMGSMAPQNGLYYMAEVPFAFFFVLALYLMLKAEKAEGKKKLFLSICLAIVIAYSYTVHTRFLVLIGTILLVIVLYRILCKRNVVQYAVFAFVLVLAFFACKAWVGNVQDILYKTDIVGKVIDGNDAMARLGYIGDFLRVFTDIDYTLRFGRNILSLIGVYTLLTGGMIWIAGIVMLSKFIEIIRRKEYNKTDRAYIILTMCAFISFVGMNVLTALNGALNIYEYKWLTYYRYGKPFVGVIFILALVYLWKTQMTKVQMGIAYLGIFASIYCSMHFTMQMLWTADIADVSPVGWMHYFFYYGQDTKEYFTGFAIAAVIVVVIFLICILLKRQKLALGIYLMFSMVLTLSENKFNEGVGEQNYELINQTYAFMEEHRDDINIPIYFLQGTYSGKLRFALYDVDMHYVLTEEEFEAIDFENAIVLADYDLWERDYGDDFDQPEYRIVLDEMEYVFTSNQAFYELVEQD